ncbi:MAG: YncE family protein [Gemmataceae bacterium]
MKSVRSSKRCLWPYVGSFALAILWAMPAAGADPAALKLVQTIPLKGPEGRLDHLAIDASHARLFVANMANSSLDIVDLKAGKLARQIPDQKKIQGIAFVPELDRIFVGNGDDGVCNVFDGKDYKLLKAIKLPDADNVRYDKRTNRIYVAHAEKSLAVIDPKSFEIKADIKLPASPEAFLVDSDNGRLYLNTPSPSQVLVIDTQKNKVIETFPLKLAGDNFPLALDKDNQRLFVGCRKKPKIVVLDSKSGNEITSVDIPSDLDDLFFDAKRKRIYASCGEGFLTVIRQLDPDRYEVQEKIPTAKLARTSLFEPETGRLYLVMPKQKDKEGPSVRVYQAVSD